MDHDHDRAGIDLGVGWSQPSFESVMMRCIALEKWLEYLVDLVFPQFFALLEKALDVVMVSLLLVMTCLEMETDFRKNGILDRRGVLID